MKKIVVTLLFGLVALAGSVFADVDCSSITVCTADRGDDRCHPSAIFTVKQAQTVEGTLKACGGQDCGEPCGDTVPFSFDLGEGTFILVASFDEEPPECTSFSTEWVFDACDPACGNHHCITPDCPVGATSGNLNVIEMVIPN